jgi:outer membrane protein assembly factor BamD
MLPNLSSRGRARGMVVVALCAAALALTGCSHRKLMLNSPTAVYQQAKKDLADLDFNGAIKLFQRITAVFPFTPEARQAQLDLIYAYYRAGQDDSAIDAANTFIRQNPTHPRIDYAWYMKGLIRFPKRANPIERLFGAKLAKRPPINVRKSFAAFRVVVTRFPHSIYARDAWQRMIYLRDRLAAYDTYVARYYYSRGAYVAAVRRGQLVLENYEGAPAVKSALAIMIISYDRLGLKQLAAQARKVYAANFTGSVAQAADIRVSHWWHFW